MDGGGGYSSGGTFAVHGTIGQPDAGFHSGGGYAVQGGFWRSAGFLMTGTIFRDGFESVGKRADIEARRTVWAAGLDAVTETDRGRGPMSPPAVPRAPFAIGIARLRPPDVSLLDAARRGAAVEYEVWIANASANDIADLQVRVPPPVALRDLLWLCAAGDPGCIPPQGVDAVSARIDLPVGATARLRLSALLDDSQAFVVVRATATGPGSATLRAEAVLIEPIGESALARDGFEPRGPDEAELEVADLHRMQ